MSEESTFVVSAPETKTTPEGVNLVLRSLKSLGHAIRYYMPGSSADFNKLDPDRKDAALEEANNNIAYRSMHPDFRHWFLHGREAVEAKDGQPAIGAIEGIEAEVLGWNIPVPEGFKYKDGTPVDSWARATKIATNAKGEERVKDGEKVEVFDVKKETEDDYYSRIISMAVAAKKFASEDAARAHWQALAEDVALEVPCDVKAAERKSRLPTKLPAKDKSTAAVMIVRGTVSKFITTIFSAIRPVEWVATGDTTKMYTGKATIKGVEVDFNVSDKDATSLGWLVKEYREWKAAQAAEDLAA